MKEAADKLEVHEPRKIEKKEVPVKEKPPRGSSQYIEAYRLVRPYMLHIDPSCRPRVVFLPFGIIPFSRKPLMDLLVEEARLKQRRDKGALRTTWEDLTFKDVCPEPAAQKLISKEDITAKTKFPSGLIAQYGPATNDEMIQALETRQEQRRKEEEEKLQRKKARMDKAKEKADTGMQVYFALVKGKEWYKLSVADAEALRLYKGILYFVFMCLQVFISFSIIYFSFPLSFLPSFLPSFFLFSFFQLICDLYVASCRLGLARKVLEQTSQA
jgi:hypothetical protein